MMVEIQGWAPIVGLVAAAGAAVWRYVRAKRRPVRILIQDQDLKPSTGCYLLLADGSKEAPTEDGLVALPSWRVGEEVSLRATDTRQELLVFSIPLAGRQPHRVVVHAGSDSKAGA